MFVAGFAFAVWRAGCPAAGFSRFRLARRAVSVLKFAGKIEVKIVLLVRGKVQRDPAVTHFLLIETVQDLIFRAT